MRVTPSFAVLVTIAVVFSIIVALIHVQFVVPVNGSNGGFGISSTGSSGGPHVYLESFTKDARRKTSTQSLRMTVTSTSAKNTTADRAMFYQKRKGKYDEQLDYRKCQMNEPWPRNVSHGCVTSRTPFLTHCQFHQLKIDVTKVHSVRGGENLTTVMGQAEDVEFPTYDKGAFSTKTPPNLVAVEDVSDSDLYYIRHVLDAMETKIDAQHDCKTTFSGTTLFLTRYEYCNLYHTMTDWWNAVFSMDDEMSPASTSIVFLDAHPQGSLDAVWGAMFVNVTHVQHLPPHGVCFEKAILIPPGYNSQLWGRQRDFSTLKKCPSMMDHFVQFMVKAHGLEHITKIPGLVILIERIPYIGHPRSNPSKAQRIITNMAHVRDRLANETTADVRLVQFETMTFREQLKLIRSTHIMIGNHGAGIAHMLFLQHGAHVLELKQSPSYMMLEFSAWKPDITHTLLPSIFGERIVSDEYITDSLLPAVRSALGSSV